MRGGIAGLLILADADMRAVRDRESDFVEFYKPALEGVGRFSYALRRAMELPTHNIHAKTSAILLVISAARRGNRFGFR
jgi:hypothetical protein